MPVSEKYPFTSCVAVDMDLCVVGVERAMAVWLRNFGTIPTVLWVAPEEMVRAEQILASANIRLVVLADPNYHQWEWWSVGTRIDRGFGSGGS